MRLKEFLLKKTVPALIIVAGIAIAAYPYISNEAYMRHASSVTADSEGSIRSASDEEISELKKQAVKYNESLSENVGVLSDPFDENVIRMAPEGYDKQLSVSGGTVMGEIVIPEIDVNLPIYHGTSQTVLQEGCGHLEGSSLPVGGKSTHSVITGHTGLRDKRMFTDLELLRKGDVFYLSVLGERLYYRIIRMSVVLPGETGSLGIRKGEDLCTLVTCTPYGVNDHRLLVTGKRCSAPDDEGGRVSGRRNGSRWMRDYETCIVTGTVLSLALVAADTIMRKKHDRKRKKGRDIT